MSSKFSFPKYPREQMENRKQHTKFKVVLTEQTKVWKNWINKSFDEIVKTYNQIKY